MRLTDATLTSCLAAGLASIFHTTHATQVPLVLEPFSQIAAKGTSSLSKPANWTLPRGSDNSAIVFDKYSLALGGGQQRLFVFAAEFHPWRLPVPSLWRDVLQKIRAAGFNTVSIYTHWGLIQPSADPETIDLSGVNDLDFFLRIAKEEGLFVIVRPGPYINAETTAGGMAPWTVNINAALRTNDTAWQDAWKPYIDAISRVVVKHQLVFNPSNVGYPTGGSVILVQADNEYKTGEVERAYITELVGALKRNGISVPITYNDPARESNFVDLVDLYGLDSYPQRFDCSHPSKWMPIRDDYLKYHMDTNPDQPFYIPEFQSGSYDPYGGLSYQMCEMMTNASFTRVANLALMAQRVTLLSLYMAYGGTNWGGLAEPDVYTSYDYGAAINEHRQTSDKYTELKRQGNFVANFPDLAMAEQIVDKPGFNITQAWDIDAKQAVDARLLRTTVLENPETKSKFYFVRYDNTTESRRTQFAVEIESMGETVLVGERRGTDEEAYGINFLNGRDSHIIPVDQQLPGRLLLRFSTSNVYRVATIANIVVITLDYGPQQLLEWSLVLQEPDEHFTSVEMFTIIDGATVQKAQSKEWEQMMHRHSDIKVNPRVARGSIPARSEHDEGARQVVYKTSEGTYVVLDFTPTSFTRRDFAAPARYRDSLSHSTVQQSRRRGSLVNQFFGYSEDSVILIKVDLLRNATYTSTFKPLDTLHLWGSLSQDEYVTMFAYPGLTHVYWNGKSVDARTEQGLEWFYVLSLPGPSKAALRWNPPKLSNLEWRWKDSLPEAEAGFDDADWVKANKTVSFNPYTRDSRLDTQGAILFASEYGFHANNIVWRGRFHTLSTPPSDVFIKVEGGRSSAFSAWLNGEYLGSAEVDQKQSAPGQTFTIPKETLKPEGGENVLTVLQDHMGIEMEAGELPIGLQPSPALAMEAVKLPRGIVEFNFPSLRSRSIAEPKVAWKVQGNFKGEKAPDKVRRSLNEGGLHAEVEGWHLPGYDASSWPIFTGSESKGRVTFFRTTFDLDVPEDTDLGLNFKFSKVEGRNFRAQLYVNGWQMGKYLNLAGPQVRFPVHSGIIHLRGQNEVSVSVWNLDDDEKWSWDPRRDLELEVNHVLSGEPRDGYVLEAPGWEELRGSL